MHRAKEEGGLYSHNHLLAAQKRVTDELARAQCHGGIDVRHLCDCVAEDRSIFCKVDGEGGWRFNVDFSVVFSGRLGWVDHDKARFAGLAAAELREP